MDMKPAGKRKWIADAFIRGIAISIAGEDSLVQTPIRVLMRDTNHQPMLFFKEVQSVVAATHLYTVNLLPSNYWTTVLGNSKFCGDLHRWRGISGQHNLAFASRTSTSEYRPGEDSESRS